MRERERESERERERAREGGREGGEGGGGRVLFFFSVSGPRVREDGRDSAHILTLVLLVGAWEADHVINFGGGALGLACFRWLDSFL